MHVDLREFRAAYLAEVDEHLGAINGLLLAVETASRDKKPSPRDLRELMRLLHTIKGLSAMVGIEPVVTIAHRMETVLRAADRAGGLLGGRALEALIAGTRAIEARVHAVANDEPVTEPALATLAALDEVDIPEQQASPIDASLDPEIAAKLTASEREQLAQGASAGRRGLRIDFAPTHAKAERGQTISTVRERLASLGEIVRVLPLAVLATEGAPGGLVFSVILLTDALDEHIAESALIPRADIREIITSRLLPITTGFESKQLLEQPPVQGGELVEPQRPGVLRVEVGRIDDAIEKLSGLIVTRSRLTRAVGRLRDAGVDTRELESIMADNARQLRDLRGAILHVRMVPIAAVLDRLPLVIRSLGKSTGKQVRLLLEDGGAELDKTVAERIFPALLHLLRNAVDHGIEDAAERARLGKPEQATITVSSSSRNNRQIEVRVTDDGRGIDRERVAAKAGRDVPTDDATLLELVCRPGLSTRDEVDMTSGRGIGMDVVHKIIVDGLGGELTLETTPGRGTTFVLRVPLTIAIVDAFSVWCAGQRFVVPVPVVEEIVEIVPEKLVRGPRVRGRDTRFLARRGEAVPVVELARALGLAASPSVDARGPAHPTDGRQALVVRRGHDEPVAFAIDRIVGRQETVVRPLADPLVTVVGVTGSTDLGDGRATLVLDLLGLCARLGRETESAA